MKKYLLIFCLVFLKAMPGTSQEQFKDIIPATSESIQQIWLPGMDAVQLFQHLSSAMSNSEFTLQKGTNNLANITQHYNGNSEMGNQLYSVQSGNSNEQSLAQTGNGNFMVAYQLDVKGISTLENQYIQSGIQAPSLLSGMNPDLKVMNFQTGDHNTMRINQEGSDNAVVAVQHGSDNVITADQIGNYNYLLALQIGTNNTVNGYRQENESDQIQVDRVIQIGNNLSLKSDESLKASLSGNTFQQTGNNLSLELNTDLLNSPGGIEIHQKGNDMKVVIDQSYFSYPMK